MSNEALSMAVNNTHNENNKLIDDPKSSSAPATKGRIYDDIIQTIGNTPLVRLSRLGNKYKVQGEILAKVEYFNPAGSIKDRPALAMINALMLSDSFDENTQIIEATSGNNGVACAWICAMKGIPLTIVIQSICQLSDKN